MTHESESDQLNLRQRLGRLEEDQRTMAGYMADLRERVYELEREVGIEDKQCSMGESARPGRVFELDEGQEAPAPPSPKTSRRI